MVPWRIATIHLDDDERMVSVTAVVGLVFLDRIRQHLPDTKPLQVLRSDRTSHWVEVDVQQLAGIRAVAAGVNDDDPRCVPGMYESIDRVLNALSDD